MSDAIKLTRGSLSAEVNYHGAELKSFKRGDREYMWCGNPEFWGRTSPVLFPFVGQAANGTYRHEGKEYKTGQHGFARDMDFELEKSTDTSCTFVLKSDEDTKARYPFDFELIISYELVENGIRVMWEVVNTGKCDMHFSIGAHPAFNCVLSDTSLVFRKEGKPVNSFVNSVFGKGLLSNEKEMVNAENGQIKLNINSFDNDAWVIENNQADSVEILENSNSVLSLSFDAPLFGIWSPPGKDAPFVCIEPWYGRTDKEGFDGELKDREWNNTIASGERFKASYMITLEKSLLIKDTTKSERIALIREWQEPDDGLNDTDLDLFDLYADFINGKKEIAECNAAFQAEYIKEEDEEM